MIKKIIALILCFVILFPLTARAQDPAVKLGRGITNFLTGWVELPKQIYETTVDEGLFLGITIGIARGVAMLIVRMGAGVYEIITFPFPIPENYSPVFMPEYVWQH